MLKFQFHCCGESNNIACLAMFKSLTEKHCTINHMIIFNDSISKFYQCRIWGFCRGISMFFSICLGKKKCCGNEILTNLKKYVSKNKIYFCSRKNSNVSLNKKVIFVFHTIFKLDFITQIIYCIIHRCLCSHFILFCSLISVSKKWNIETMLIFPYSYSWQKFEQPLNEWKKS